jgi:polyhydroxybutyrate depolymerase
VQNILAIGLRLSLVLNTFRPRNTAARAKSKTVGGFVFTQIVKHTALCLLSTFLLTSLLASCGTPESRGEGPLRGLIRDRIRERLQQKGQGAGGGLQKPVDVSSAGESRQLMNQGIERTYALYTPSSYTGTSAMPLVIGLHGGHTDPGRFAKTTEFNALADKEGFIVAYPAGVNKNWNDGRNSTTLPKQSDVAFISAMIDDIQKNRKIDSRRIYATGISNGGFMTQRLACELSHQIAAFASVASTIPVPLVAQCKPNKPVPVLMINSPADAFVPWEGGNMTRGEGGSILSVKQMVTFWRTNNQCLKQDSTQSQRASVNDGTTVSISRSSGAQNRSDVVFARIDGGGHSWPGGARQPEMLVGKTTQNLNATQFIWNFFKTHTL